MQKALDVVTLDPLACYRALSARDARFDGVFFVGVTTTGVYCRPVCRARLPRPDRCRYFSSAPEAEGAGYRPCLRCHPERAPGHARVDAPVRVGRLAGERIAAGGLNGQTVEGLAASLHVGRRQLHRAVRLVYGVSPVQLAQTYRLLTAKRLLTETRLPITRVAFASGFSSIRRFNATFRERYGMSPSSIRRHRRGSASGAITLALDYRPPLDWPGLVAFLAARATPGVEAIDGNRYVRTVSVDGHRGWIAVEPGSDGTHSVLATVSPSLIPALMPLLAGLRHLFDLDADPGVVADHLSADPALRGDVRAAPGVRVPGTLDGFELAVRGILGQQVSVRAATTLAGRLAEAFGAAAPVATAHPRRLTRYPVTAARLAGVAPEALTGLGVTRPRALCVIHVAREVAEGRLRLEPDEDVERVVSGLEAIPGIGPWTAQYIAMRALHWPDAFPCNDLVLRRSAGCASPAALATAAESWRPWRAYAAMHLWRRAGTRSSDR